ncbi:hypothetical protein R1sor_020952 [Riccia sorocarpa]|uniref:Uncharacterized protein n=1 Tax=Riccia sorocarpa TaxID=122646 RepID=A0ABD3GJB6_9MARC
MVEIKLLPTSNKGKVRKAEGGKQNSVLRHHYPGKIEISLKHFSLSDLEEIAFGLKDSNITTLRLFCSGLDCGCFQIPSCHFDSFLRMHGLFCTEIIRFSFTDPSTSHILIKFFSALAQALGTGGWLKKLELGFKPWKRDLRVLSQAIGLSTTLKELSLRNSRIGDSGLQLLAQGLSNCLPLQILDLSGCALSDESHSSVELVLKASVGLNAQAEWQSSLRASQSDEARTNSPGLKFNRGLVALDLSFNSLSDISAEHICDVLRLGAPLAGTVQIEKFIETIRYPKLQNKDNIILLLFSVGSQMLF